jgi:hypothetical protein
MPSVVRGPKADENSSRTSSDEDDASIDTYSGQKIRLDAGSVSIVVDPAS